VTHPANRRRGPPIELTLRRRRTRLVLIDAGRRWLGGGLVAAVLIGAVVVSGGGGSTHLSGVPLVGREADDVYADIQRAGYAIADGRPASADYDGLIDGNACASSRTFVRADTDVGWAFICVDPPADAYRRISGAFEEAPMLMGPVWVHDGGGEALVIGFGWPADASRQLYEAIGASGGSYLVEP
jgi:hypothetical protein